MAGANAAAGAGIETGAGVGVAAGTGATLVFTVAAEAVVFVDVVAGLVVVLASTEAFCELVTMPTVLVIGSSTLIVEFELVFATFSVGFLHNQ